MMLSPLGTAFNIFRDRIKRNFPSWTSSTITAAVIVLVFEAARKCVSARGEFVPPSSVEFSLRVHPKPARHRSARPRSRRTRVSLQQDIGWHPLQREGDRIHDINLGDHAVSNGIKTRGKRRRSPSTGWGFFIRTDWKSRLSE